MVRPGQSAIEERSGEPFPSRVVPAVRAVEFTNNDSHGNGDNLCSILIGVNLQTNIFHPESAAIITTTHYLIQKNHNFLYIYFAG